MPSLPIPLEPLIPDERDTRLAGAGSRTLSRLLQEQQEQNTADIHLHFGNDSGNGSGGEAITLPTRVAQLVSDVLERIGKGESLVIVPVESELTTSQAAAMIGVSRPFLVQLLEQGDLPFHWVGTHRRVRLADVLAYRAERERRFRVMAELTAETEALGLYS